MILPNWCKKFGIIVFIIFSILGDGDDFNEGFKSGYNSVSPSRNHIVSIHKKLTPFSSYFGENLTHFF
ncbi:hypothetical protein Lupro_07920 [Lutibacter profundi]|uniref:Uncharacterized protein n=1 Tax=Lutibacter profundi TaxID=1622118 RepID=A0A120IEC1_9FLAO|nr:hypothetical protein [Lutibacter profundi]AMC11185.1 hypothetical protein Lupro_07920 [Lutibacter profundi]